MSCTLLVDGLLSLLLILYNIASQHVRINMCTSLIQRSVSHTASMHICVCIEVPDRSWSRLHLDILSPCLKTKQNKDSLFCSCIVIPHLGILEISNFSPVINFHPVCFNKVNINCMHTDFPRNVLLNRERLNFGANGLIVGGAYLQH